MFSQISPLNLEGILEGNVIKCSPQTAYSVENCMHKSMLGISNSNSIFSKFPSSSAYKLKTWLYHLINLRNMNYFLFFTKFSRDFNLVCKFWNSFQNIHLHILPHFICIPVMHYAVTNCMLIKNCILKHCRVIS